MILTIRHLGKGEQGERFVVERGSDGRRAEEAVLAGGESEGTGSTHQRSATGSETR
ncbi:MAG: hypothetical protein HQL74_14770 [Magnetococcales bacterium]|nr:hypothetical protein [Magnetococcales bacterium]